MTSINTGIPINSPHVRAIDAVKMKMFHISEAPEDVYKNFIEASEKVLEAKHRNQPDTDDNPAYKEYATVKVNGEIVAKIDNNGFVETSNALGNKLRKLAFDDTGNGPALAQERAEKIADLLGGEVVKSSTALTQSAFNAIPKPDITIDYQAMRDDPMYVQLQRSKEARTLFLAQEIAQATGSTVASDVVALETAKGKKNINIDEYFSPKPGNINLDDLDFLLPNAQNIDTLSTHASAKFKQLLQKYNIPEGPEQISFGTDGQIRMPSNYPYSEEVRSMLSENPAMERELSTIAALTSHHVGMQKAMSGKSDSAYIAVILKFSDTGDMNVLANGKPYNAGNISAFANDKAKENSSDAPSNTSSTESTSDTYGAEKTATEEFLEYMSKTSEERYYEAFLKQEGLTQEELDALPIDERQAIIEKIEERIEQAIKEKAEEKTNTVISTTPEQNLS